MHVVKEEMRMVARVVTVSSELMTQSRNTVSQLQVRPPSTAV